MVRDSIESIQRLNYLAELKKNRLVLMLMMLIF